MPNQGNKSNSKSDGVVQPKKNKTVPNTQKEGNGKTTKQSSGGKKGDTGSSTNEGS
jgi:hypothetical protein